MGAELRVVHALPGAQLAWLELSEPAPDVLTPGERALFDALPPTARRRREWFSGRMAVRAALQAAGAGPLSILADERGIPRLEGPDAARFHVALSHGQHHVAAVAVRDDAPYPCAGVDLVDARDHARVRRFEARVFSDRERALLERRPDALLLAWGAREAFAKASATGMFAFALRHVELLGIDPEAQRLELNLPGTTAGFEPTREGGLLVFAGATPAAARAARAIAGLA